MVESQIFCLAQRLGRDLPRLSQGAVGSCRPRPYDQRMLHESPRSGNHEVSSLSPREREVLSMTSLGLTNQQVAERLHVTVHAVKFHLASSYRKLGVTNRTEAAVVYLRGQLGIAGSER